MKVGVLGLGAMGKPMASNLHKAGMLHGFWNRSLDKAQSLAEETGIAAAGSPAELAADCDMIITSVSADQDLDEVIDAMLPALQAGSVIVDTSTVGVDTVLLQVAKLAPHDVAFLDAPVSGGVEGAKKATLSMMVGGNAETLARVRPVLEKVAARIVHMGDSGTGQATKAVNQIMGAGINQAVTEALAFGAAMGLDMDKVIEVVSGGASGNWFLQHRGPTMTQGKFDAGFKVALHHKDLSICRKMAEKITEGDNRLPIVEMTLLHYERLMDAGFGDEDISSLFRIKSKLFDKNEK
jgi:3-hydroxyisobutyrate dehydrogenase